MTPVRLRVGTRGSALAVTQTGTAAELLRRVAAEAGLEVEPELVRIKTTGDVASDRPFAEIGPKGVFAVELERALDAGEIDVAVHSLKDLPTEQPAGLVIAAVPEREDPRDVVVSSDGATLDTLPPGAVVGTSSERRRALVGELRPDLRLTELRGNVDTRLAKVARGEVAAAVLAAAGLVRLGRTETVVQWLDAAVFVPAPGQGALAIEARADRLAGDLRWVARADHAATRAAVEAERAFARTMEGGCSLPLGAWARPDGAGLLLDVFVASGGRIVRDADRGANPRALGDGVARRVLDRLRT